MNQNGVLRKAVAYYGREAQIIQLSEEVGELLSVVSKWNRGRKSARYVIDEMADVMVMIGQISIMLEDDGMSEVEIDEHVARTIEKKIERLEIRMEADHEIESM